MERTGSNKTSLHLLRRRMQAYRSVLPSLELKRSQLMLMLAARRRRSAETRRSLEARFAAVSTTFPMLAAAGDLQALVRVREVARHEETVLGVRLPVLDDIEFETCDYGLLSTPAWTEGLIGELRTVAASIVAHGIDVECIRRLESALARTIQRVNLFEKVLVPSTLSRIRNIEIFLQDGERAAIVRSKMAKRRNLRRQTPESPGHRS